MDVLECWLANIGEVRTFGDTLMTIALPADVQPIIDQPIATGRGADEVDVVRQALRLYDQVQQRRQSLKGEIRRGIESGDSVSGELVSQELEQLTRC